MKIEEAMARVLAPDLFSDDPQTAHMAASPMTVEYAREATLALARTSIAAIAPLIAQEAAKEIEVLQRHFEGRGRIIEAQAKEIEILETQRDAYLQKGLAQAKEIAELKADNDELGAEWRKMSAEKTPFAMKFSTFASRSRS